MKNTKQILQRLLDEKIPMFDWYSKRHEKAKAISIATCDNEDLKEIHAQAEKDSKMNYDYMTENTEETLALEDAIKRL